jgi:replicative DNA helicase
VVGGFSSTGKSAFACNLAADVMLQRDKHVAIFSAEMTQEQFAIRMLALLSGIPAIHIRDHVSIGVEQHNNLEQAQEMFEKSNVKIYDSLFEMQAIRSEATRIKHQEGLDVLILDYIQNVRVIGDEVKDAREVALECQRLAKELSCTVIALSQVSNAYAQQDSAEKGMGDFYSFKGSGAIRDAADVAIMLRRDRKNQSSTLRVTVEKNRHGSAGLRFDCDMNLATGRVVEMERYDGDDDE